MAEKKSWLKKIRSDDHVEPAPVERDVAQSSIPHSEYFELKTVIHDRLLDLIDLHLLDSLEEHMLRKEIRGLVEKILIEQQNRVPLNLTERQKIIGEIEDEVLGYGPLEPFLQDPTVSDILVNTYSRIYVERFGLLELTEQIIQIGSARFGGNHDFADQAGEKFTAPGVLRFLTMLDIRPFTVTGHLLISCKKRRYSSTLNGSGLYQPGGSFFSMVICLPSIEI